MSAKFNFPAPFEVPDRLPLYVTVPSSSHLNDVESICKRLEIKGPVSDAGVWSVIRDGSWTLEVYQASQSFRLERDSFDIEEFKESSVAGRRECKVLADTFHAQKCAPVGISCSPSLSDVRVVVASREKEEIPRVTALQVSYRYSVDNYPFVGPGSKAQVTIGLDGRVHQAYRFWRTIRKAGTVVCERPKQVFDRFASSPRFAELTEATVITVGTAELGMLCLPPTEIQTVLLPVYVLRGTQTTELGDQGFVNYMSAAETNAVDAKLSGWFPPHPPLVVD